MMFQMNSCVTCILILFCFSFSGIISSNILGLFTSPHRSHMLVYQGVIRGLLKKGHNITIITVLPINDEEIVSKNVTIIKLKVIENPRSAHGIFRQIAVIAASGKVFNDPRFQKFLREKNTFDLIILGYLFNDYQLGVGAHFKCPIVVIWTAQPISFVKRFIGEPNQWMDVPQPFVRSQVVGVRSLMYGIFETAFGWILDYIMDDLYREYFPPEHYPSLAYMQTNVSLVLCNHHFSEKPIQAHFPNMIEISGIQIKENLLTVDLINFINSADHGVIYFCLGTVVSARQLGPEVLNMFIKVFTSIPQKVIWKIEGVKLNTTKILTGNWFPQSSILAHSNTKLFITHGGKASTIEALYYAKPTIVLPFFGDQFANAHRIANKGFGLKLQIENINASQLRKYIIEVLNNETFYTNIKKASIIFKDRPLTAEETAIYWIEYVIRHRGAVHMQTPTKDTNFIQYFNVDVFLCIFCYVCAIKIFVRIANLYGYRYIMNLFPRVLSYMVSIQ